MAARKPVAPKSAGVPKDNYEYTARSGDHLSLPPFNSVKPGVIRRIRKLPEVDQFFTVMEELTDEDTIAVIDDMDYDEFEEFQRGWYSHAGVDLGE